MGTDMQTVVGLIARHFLTGAGVWLVHVGWIGSADQANFVTIAAGIVSGAAGLAWSWWQKKGHAQLKDDLALWKARAQRQQVQMQTAQGVKP